MKAWLLKESNIFLLFKLVLVHAKEGFSTTNYWILKFATCSLLFKWRLLFFKMYFCAGKGKRYAEFRIKGDFRHAKMADAYKFRKVLEQRLNIPRRYINLVGIGKGSIILVFQLPDIGIKRLRQAVSEKHAWLQECNILDVHIDGYQCVTIQDENSLGKFEHMV